MKNIVRDILKSFDKSGRVFGSVLCSVFVLLLVASVYGVFGEGATGGAVVESGSSGYFRDSDKLGGWEYVGGKFNYTAHTLVEDRSDLGKGWTEEVRFAAPEFIKEDDILKNKREAKSLKGYYEPFRIRNWTVQELYEYYNLSINDVPVNQRGDVIAEFVYEDWNYTDRLVKVKLNNVSQAGILVNVDIPIKIDGVQVKNEKFSSINKISDVIQVHATIGQNISVGFTSTEDIIISANNASFKDTMYGNDIGGASYYRAFGTSVDLEIGSRNAQVFFVSIWADLSELAGTTVEFAQWEASITNNYIDVTNLQFTVLTQNWTEYLGTSGDVANASMSSPCGTNDGTCVDYYNADGSAEWVAPMSAVGEWKPDVYGSILAVHVDNSTTAEWHNYTLNNEAFQTLIDNPAYSIGINGTLMTGATLTGVIWGSAEGGTNAWNLRVITSSSNTAPSNPSVSLSPSPTTGPDFDLTCTFNATDAENTSLIAYVDWYKDDGSGYETAVWNDMPVTSGTETYFKLENPGNTTIGETWKCGVTVSDGELNSTQANSSETEIVSIANKTDFTTGIGNIQSNKVKDVYVYDASKESWNREDASASWYTGAGNKNFPDKSYLLLTDQGLDIFDSLDSDATWMTFEAGTDKAIDGNDFTSVYALDGIVYVGSNTGLYVLDFANDNLSKYDYSNGLAYTNNSNPFWDDVRNVGVGYHENPDASKKLASNDVRDVHAARVRGKHLVGVATASGVNIVNMHDLTNMNDNTIAELIFNVKTSEQILYDSDSVFLADDGTLYYSENKLDKGAGKTKLAYKYDVDDYTATGQSSGTYYLSNNSNWGSAYPHFLSERINDIYVTSETSRRHLSHNTIYVATESGVSVIQEDQPDPGNGESDTFGYSGSSEPVGYNILVGLTDNVTSIAARSDGGAIYVGTNDGGTGGSVSKISLNSNTLLDAWNTTSEVQIVADNITSLDFFDGDLLVGTLDGGATQIVEEELDHYLVTEYDKHRVIEIDDTGLIHWQFGTYNTPGDDGTHLSNPTHSVRLKNGNTLIADYGNQRILEVNPDGGIVTNITNSTPLSDATYLDGVYSVDRIMGFKF